MSLVIGFLSVVPGYALGHVEPVDDLGDGRTVEAVEVIVLFLDLAVFLHYAGVQTVGDRLGVVGVLELVVVSLDLSLGHSGTV